MKPAPFEYHAPETVADVVGLLAAHGDDAKPLAGGQSLVPMLSLRLARFEHLVDLNRVTELTSVERRNGRRRRRRDDPPGGPRATRGPADDGPAARPGGSAHRPLPDPQPGHRRGVRGPRRPGERAAGGGAGPRRRAARRRARRDPRRARRRVLRRELDDRRSTPTSSSPPSPSRSGRAAAGSRSRRWPAATATSRSPATACAVALDAADRIERCADRPVRHGQHAGARHRRRGGAHRPGGPTRPSSSRSAQLAVRDLDPPDDVHALARYRRSSARTSCDAGLTRGARGGPPVSEVAVHDDGERRAAARARRGAQDPRRLPPRGLRAHRHASRVRARRLRRLHGPRSTGPRCAPASCSPCRPTVPRSRPSRASADPPGRSARCRRRSARSTACSAGSARRGSWCPCTPFLAEHPRPSRRRDPRGPVGQPVPLHRVPGHHPGRGTGRVRDGGLGRGACRAGGHGPDRPPQRLRDQPLTERDAVGRDRLRHQEALQQLAAERPELRSSWSTVSIPSAIVRRCSEWASPTIAATIACDSGSLPSPSTNDLSIFSASTGNALQVRERRVAGPEVVDREVDPEGLERRPAR